MSEIKVNKIDPTRICVGDMMSFTYYTKVEGVLSNGEELMVTNLDHDKKGVRIKGKDLIINAFSADQYSEDKKVSKTHAAEILISSHNKPLTVCFDKADGTERILRGRLVGAEPLLGRSMVEDLEVNEENRLRQVDHRTLKWLIVDCVRYEVK